MKACKKCKVPCSGVDLSILTRIFVVADIFRLFIFFGPMLIIFHACTDLHPTVPRLFSNVKTKGPKLSLYAANRQDLSDVEAKIIAQVEKECGKDYINNLPKIWEAARPTLYKSLYLLGIAGVLPLVTAVLYLLFHKRERIAFFIGFLHLGFVMIAVILQVYGIWFSFDSRLCLLQSLSSTVSVPALFATAVVVYAVGTKLLTLNILRLFVKSRFKTPKAAYVQPTPVQELLTYLREMRSYGVKPKLNFEFPDDPKVLSWTVVEQLIKKILIEVRLQVAELHKDDPLVNDLLQSGKLHHPAKKSSAAEGEDGGGPSILKVMKMRMQEGTSSEYNLLKSFKQRGDADETDVEVILPEPELRRYED